MVYPRGLKLGININLRYDDNAYTTGSNVTDRVIPRLKELGIKLVRDGAIGQNFVDRFKQVSDATGCQLCLLCDPRVGIQPSNIIELIERIGVDRIAYIEGANEWDGVNHIYTTEWGYTTGSWQEGVYIYQENLWLAVKQNRRTAHIPVLSASFAQPEPIDTLGYDLRRFSDCISMHSYPGTGLPDQWLDSRWIPKSQNVAPQRNIVVTETGYASEVGHSCYIDETTKITRLPQIPMENFKRGITTTFLFELFDGDTGNFGLYDVNNNPKPVVAALKAEMGR